MELEARGEWDAASGGLDLSLGRVGTLRAAILTCSGLGVYTQFTHRILTKCV